MSTEIDDWIPPISHAPASSAVYQRVRSHIRSLQDLRKSGRQEDYEDPRSIFPRDSVELRKLEEEHFPSSVHVSRLASMNYADIEKEGLLAQLWLLGILESQDKILSREHELRMFRSAVEKQMDGRQEDWTDLERLYMALTDQNLASTDERLRAALMVVLHFNYVETRKDVSEASAEITERLQRASIMDAQLLETRDRIVERIQSMYVDHFACAIPLSLLAETANNASVVDDNAGCCPICQHSYTSLSDRPIKELLADYPVRIKYCGHMVGKACLEQWMRTPKIEEAKYPHRTCPLSRVKLEGVASPPVPQGLVNHLKISRRAMETARDLMYEYGVELREHLSSISACMSEEIACLELLSGLRWTEGGKKGDCLLDDKLAELKKEKWAWGFRGDGVWTKLRTEWMNSGVVRMS